MPPQTNITEKRIRMSIILFMHINVGAGLAPTSLVIAPASLAPVLSLTLVSLPKNSVAFSDGFSPNSLAWQSPSTFSRLMILPLTLASFPKNYVALSEHAASLFYKIFIYQHLIKVYISAFGKSAGILQTPVI